MFDWLPRWMRWVFSVLVVALVVWWFVVPRFGEAGDALDLVTDVNPFLVLASGALLAAAFAAQAQMVRSVLPDASVLVCST